MAGVTTPRMRPIEARKRQEMRQEFGKSGEKRAKQENSANSQPVEIKGNTTMVRIGIVGVGFMGMLHYLQECDKNEFAFSRIFLRK
jgi:hypothetical protein